MKSSNQCYQFLVYVSRVTLHIQAYEFIHTSFLNMQIKTYHIHYPIPSSINFRSVIISGFFPFIFILILDLANIAFNLNHIVTQRELEENFE